PTRGIGRPADGPVCKDLRCRALSTHLPVCPPNRLDDAMAYCPDTKSIVYAGYNRQLWLLDLARSQGRKARQRPPGRVAFGQTIFYDPSKKRMLVAGGGPLDARLIVNKENGCEEHNRTDPRFLLGEYSGRAWKGSGAQADCTGPVRETSHPDQAGPGRV